MDQFERLSWLEQAQLLGLNSLRLLPVTWVSTLGAYLGQYVARQAIRDNLPWIRAMHNSLEQLKGITDQHQREDWIIEWTKHIGQVQIQFLILQRMVEEGYLEIVGQENLENTTQPTIYASCHLSNWELLAYVATKLPGITCDLYVPPQNPVYRRVAAQARQAWEAQIDFIEYSPRAIFQMARNLADGKNLLLFVDEEKDSYIWGPSLGRDLPYAGNRWLAARLAVRHQVDILPGYVRYLGNSRYQVVVEPKLKRCQGSFDEQAKYLADQLDECMDRWIREHLDEWYWLSWLDLDKPCPLVREE